MGIREWILKPYLQRLQVLEDKLTQLEDKIQTLDGTLRQLQTSKVDKETFRLLQKLVDSNGITLRSLQKEIENMRLEIESLKLHSEMEQLKTTELSREEAKALLLDLIKKGHHSPTELKRLIPFGVNKMYKLLEELEKDGLIRKIGPKRKRKYIPAEEVV